MHAVAEVGDRYDTGSIAEFSQWSQDGELPAHDCEHIGGWPGIMHTNEPADVFKYYAIGNDDECWPYLGNSWGGRSGYERRPYFMATGRRQIAYRWIYELYHGVVLTPDQLILHSCDNGAHPIGCGNVHHMRIGTAMDNAADRSDRQRQGLPFTVVRAIRKLLDEGITQQEIADRYGVARKTISAIATQKHFRHVPD